MEGILSIFLAFSSFLFGFFGTPIPPESATSTPQEAEVVATTTVEATTSVPVIIDRPTPKPTWIPTPSPSVVPEPVLVPATTTVTSTPASSRSSGGSSSAVATGLTISVGSLKDIAEKDTVSFTALYGNKDVTAEATWEVLGPIGSISKGVFTAKLSSTYAEFGHAPGAVTASYKDPVTKKEYSAESSIFEVEAYIPDDIDIGGQ